MHVDGVSRYELDGKGHVHLHALENLVMSGPDKKLLNFPNLEYLWRLPALVPAPAAAGPGGWAMPVPAHGARAGGAVACDAAAARFAYDAIGRAVAATKQHIAAARSTYHQGTAAARAAAPSTRSTTLSMRIGIDETYEGRRPGETPVERAARERQEDADEAARLKALRTPPADEKSGGFGLPGFLTGMRRDACETNYDCERPMVCCDLLVARVCCSSGLGIGPQQQGEMGLQGQLIPIPIDKDEAGPYPNQGRAPPQGNQPWQ